MVLQVDGRIGFYVILFSSIGFNVFIFSSIGFNVIIFSMRISHKLGLMGCMYLLMGLGLGKEHLTVILNVFMNPLIR